MFFLNKKTITGNRFAYILLDRLKEDYANKKLSLAEGIVVLFCCNFSDPETGIVSWNGKSEKYAALLEHPTSNLAQAVELVTNLKHSATYAAINNLLKLGYLSFDDENNEYIVSSVKEMNNLLTLPKNKQKKLSAKQRDQLKYFRVPFCLFDTDLLSFIIKSKKLSYLLCLLDMFKLISQHLAFFGNKKFFDKKALSLEFKIDDLKHMLKAPFSKAPVSTRTVTKVFIGYFSELCDSVLPFGEIHKSGTFIKKIRFNFSKKIVNEVDIFARKQELDILGNHLATTQKGNPALDNNYKRQLANYCFCDYNSAFWGKTLSNKHQMKLIQDLSIELKAKNIRDLRKTLFLKSALLFDSYLTAISAGVNVSQNMLSSLAQRAINTTILEKLRTISEKEFANNLHDEYNALKYQLEKQQNEDFKDTSIAVTEQNHRKRQWLALNKCTALLA